MREVMAITRNRYARVRGGGRATDFPREGFPRGPHYCYTLPTTHRAVSIERPAIQASSKSAARDSGNEPPTRRSMRF